MNVTQTIATAAAGTAPRAAKLLVASLLAVAAMMVTTDRADAAQVGFLDENSDIGFADSDDYVPIYNTCLPDDVGAFYSPYYDGYAIYGSIIVNVCLWKGSGRDRRTISGWWSTRWATPEASSTAQTLTTSCTRWYPSQGLRQCEPCRGRGTRAG